MAEKQVIHEKFPHPLMDRFEKHFLSTSTMLKDDKIAIAERLEQWAADFSTVDNYCARSARLTLIMRQNVLPNEFHFFVWPQHIITF